LQLTQLQSSRLHRIFGSAHRRPITPEYERYILSGLGLHSLDDAGRPDQIYFLVVSIANGLRRLFDISNDNKPVIRQGIVILFVCKFFELLKGWQLKVKILCY